MARIKRAEIYVPSIPKNLIIEVILMFQNKLYIHHFLRSPEDNQSDR